MKYRCRYAGQRKELKTYVGVTVCERWTGTDGFLNFLADMGPRPSDGHSLDRINVYGNYEPGNCRWATQTVQNRNTRNNVAPGTSAADLCAKAGIKETTFWNRKRRGFPLEICLRPGRLNMKLENSNV
jgi:hypothetical protein